MNKNSQGIFKMLTFYDKILITAILLIAIGSYGIMAFSSRKSTDDIVIVRQNGTVVFQLAQGNMEKDGVYDFEFDSGIGQLEVKDRRVRMLPMDKAICPEAICSKTGWIEGSPKTIVCVPNRLIVSFASDHGGEVDGIAF